VIESLMYLHIIGGGLGLASGAAALLVRKGSRAHRRAGKLFLVAMLVMAGLGAGLAPLVPERLSLLGGLVTGYLVVTAWVTVWRPAGAIGRIEILGFGAALLLCGLLLALALLASASPDGTLDGQPWQGFILFGVVMPLAAAGDLMLIRRRGIAGPRRIARHLWRMCMALFIAATSFFLGQPDSLPSFMHDTGLAGIPPAAVLVIMLFWLVRVRCFSPLPGTGGDGSGVPPALGQQHIERRHHEQGE
jgi:uncharacterized membrane protein